MKSRPMGRIRQVIKARAKALVFLGGRVFVKPFIMVGRRKLNLSGAENLRILYVSLAYRGDLIMNFPAISALKRRFPGARLTCWVREYNRTLAMLNSDIDEVIVYDDFSPEGILVFKELAGFSRHRDLIHLMKSKQFDIFLDDSGAAFTSVVGAAAGIPLRLGRNTQAFGFLYHHHVPYDFDAHLIRKRFALLKHLGIDMPGQADLGPVIQIPRELVEQAFAKAGLTQWSKAYFTVQPFGGWEAKNWQNERWCQLIMEFSAMTGLLPVFVGGAPDRLQIDGIIKCLPLGALNLAGILDLSETAAIISQAQIHVGVDSVGSHLAASTGVKSLTLFGPTNPRMIAILSDRNIAVLKQTSCTPAKDKIYCCRDAGRTCPNVVCMNELQVGDVLPIVAGLWLGQRLAQITVL